MKMALYDDLLEPAVEMLIDKKFNSSFFEAIYIQGQIHSSSTIL